MALDPSIILQARPIQLDSPLQMATQAMSLKRLTQQNQVADQEFADNQAVRDAMKANTIVDDKGASLNRQGFLKQIAGVNPMKAMDYDKMFQGQDLEKLQKQTTIAKDLAWSATPETWGQVRANAQKFGLPNAEKLPEQWSPDFVQKWQLGTLDGEKQIQVKLEQQKIDNQKVENNNRRLDRQDSREQREYLKQQDNERKSNDRVQKLTEKMMADFDPDKSRTGNFGQVSAKILGAERLKTLVDAFPNGDLPPAQMEELSLGLANMLANTSGAARAQVEALVPHTWTGKLADVKQWLLSEPQGAGQQKFVEMMAHTIDREKETAQRQLNQIRARRLPVHEELKKIAPEKYNALLQSYGFDPQNVKDGQWQEPTKAAPSGQHDFNSMSDDDLDALYKKAGGK